MMDKEELLENILAILHQVKENKAILEQIFDFLVEEIDETETESVEIPEKYKKMINSIAQSIDCGSICYLNLETMEMIDIPKGIEDDLMMDEENPFQEGIDKIEKWTKKIRIEPLFSNDSFRIMERFATEISDEKFQNKLRNALNRKKPFANFGNLIHRSDFRQDWFDFKQKYLEEHVFEILQNEIK